MIEFISPQWFLFVVALLWRLIPKPVTRLMVLVVPTFVLSQVLLVPIDTQVQVKSLVGELVIYQNSEISRLFGTIFAFALGGTLLYGWTIATRAEQMWTLFYASAAFGIVYAGDMFSLFIAWELLAIGALGVIWSQKTSASAATGMRYFLIHVLGGVLFMIGLTAHLAATDFDLSITPPNMQHWYHWCMLFGIAINAAVPPFWSWVPDAYPTTSANGTVVLACFTTKSAVLVLIRLFPGVEILIPAGLMMIVYGAIYAAMENNIRRSLAYSLIGQVGFMVVCVGIGTPLALIAAAAHAFSHIAYKTLLLMTAGCLVQTTGEHHFTDMNGMARRMPDIALCAIIGGLALSAAPFTSGFVSKSLIIEAVVESHLTWVWLIMMLAAGAAMVYVGMRFVWFGFFADSGASTPEVRRLSFSMRLAVYAFTVLCITVGSWPSLLNKALSDAPEMHLYTAPHLLYQIQILAASILVFTLCYRWIKPEPGVLRDIDALPRIALPIMYRKGLKVYRYITAIASRFASLFQQSLNKGLDLHRPDGVFAQTWSTGTMALWVSVMLATFLYMYLF